MSAPAGNGDNCDSERARLFARIAELREERNQLMTNLAECRRVNRELRKQLGLGDDA